MRKWMNERLTKPFVVWIPCRELFEEFETLAEAKEYSRSFREDPTTVLEVLERNSYADLA